jgi:hypothetical protein
MQKTIHQNAAPATKALADMTADDFARAARAASTRRENAKDVRYFIQQGGTLPATPAVMVTWLTKVASQLAPLDCGIKIAGIPHQSLIRRLNGYSPGLAALWAWHSEWSHPWFATTC